MAAGAYAADNGTGDLPDNTRLSTSRRPRRASIMKTFVGDAGATQTFDDAAGVAQHDALLAAARRTPACRRATRTTGAHCGGVRHGRRHELDTREVVGDRDEDQEHQTS